MCFINRKGASQKWQNQTKWFSSWFCFIILHEMNKTNLRDLIAVTSLVILPKLDSNHWFFSPYDLEIWWMTSKNNTAPCLGYINLCALFQSHQWIQTGVTILWRAHSWEIWITGEPKASVQDNTNQTMDNGYTIEEKHKSSSDYYDHNYQMKRSHSRK